jgi:methyl-accepting chemotaxis protein
MDELHKIRSVGMRALAMICAGGTVVVWGGTFFAQTGIMPAIAATAIAALAAWLTMQGLCDAPARSTMAGAVMTYPMILLYQWSGFPWMIDMHMVFFAALAVIVILADWRAILTAATLTALHHLVGNLFVPQFVYGDNGNILRVLLHAVIVVIETGALVLLSSQLVNLIGQQAAARSAKEDAERIVEAERARVAREQQVVMDAVADRLDLLASGDLSSTISASFPAAYTRLRDSLNAATRDLNRLVTNVSTVTAQIAQGASEIRSASDDLAKRTEQQASALEQNSSTTRDLTTAIQKTAADANGTRKTIEDTQSFAEAGGGVVSRAVDAMTEIEKSANEIGQIISVIDGIAFQTNLLALNAGVEAARAGESGRGFAVVANEVRALAQRSADAASSIRSLIQTSGQQVAQGVQLVGKTGEVLGDIVQQISTVSMAITNIADAADSQSTQLSRVSGSFGQLDTVTQQNAAMVEESNAAAHHLSRAAEELRALVSQFKTDAIENTYNHQRQALRAA